MYYTRIIRIIQPTFQKTQFNKHSYNTRSCIIVHMAMYYTLYYTYILYKRSIHTVLYSRLTTHAIREVRDRIWVMRVMYTYVLYARSIHTVQYFCILEK
jgi:hypothetical protein